MLVRASSSSDWAREKPSCSARSTKLRSCELPPRSARTPDRRSVLAVRLSAALRADHVDVGGRKLHPISLRPRDDLRGREISRQAAHECSLARGLRTGALRCFLGHKALYTRPPCKRRIHFDRSMQRHHGYYPKRCGLTEHRCRSHLVKRGSGSLQIDACTSPTHSHAACSRVARSTRALRHEL